MPTPFDGAPDFELIASEALYSIYIPKKSKDQVKVSRDPKNKAKIIVEVDGSKALEYLVPASFNLNWVEGQFDDGYKISHSCFDSATNMSEWYMQ